MFIPDLNGLERLFQIKQLKQKLKTVLYPKRMVPVQESEIMDTINDMVELYANLYYRCDPPPPVEDVQSSAELELSELKDFIRGELRTATKSRSANGRVNPLVVSRLLHALAVRIGFEPEKLNPRYNVLLEEVPQYQGDRLTVVDIVYNLRKENGYDVDDDGDGSVKPVVKLVRSAPVNVLTNVTLEKAVEAQFALKTAGANVTVRLGSTRRDRNEEGWRAWRIGIADSFPASPVDKEKEPLLFNVMLKKAPPKYNNVDYGHVVNTLRRVLLEDGIDAQWDDVVRVVDSAPTNVLVDVTRKRANQVSTLLEAAGATVAVKRVPRTSPTTSSVTYTWPVLPRAMPGISKVVLPGK